MQSCISLNVSIKHECIYVENKLFNFKEKTDGWAAGCCYLPNLKRIAIISERYTVFWDHRQKIKSKNTAPMVSYFKCMFDLKIKMLIIIDYGNRTNFNTVNLLRFNY